MKSFKEFMSEDHGRDAKSLGGDGGHGNQYGRWGQEPVHMGVHRIEDPNVMQRLNAHVGLINTREYIDPRSALEHVQNALMRLGYHFEYNLNDMPTEQNVYPLNRFGGRKGFLDMDAVVKEDDGIEQATGESMVLRVEFVQDADTARYEVFAQIVPASLFGEDDVQPEAIRPNRASVPSTTGDADGINMGESRRSDSAAMSGLENELKKRIAFVKKNAKAQANKKLKQGEKSKRNESLSYVSEDVSISMPNPISKDTFEVKLDFRGGPVRKQAQKFALAAQKKLHRASFRPNSKGGSETVEVVVIAKTSNEARAKVRKVLDENVSVDHITEAQKFIVTFPTKTTRNQALADTQKLPSGLRTNASALFPGAGPANGVLFWVSDNGLQTRDLMKLIKKNKGTVVSSKVESVVNESLSRTFAFASADGRDRIEKLLGLASGERVSTSDKGKGKFKFTVTAMLRGPQIDKIMNSVKQLKGKLAEEQINEDLSRTFAFATADARNRIESLLGLASRDKVSTSDKGKGKFKFTVTAILKGPQIEKIMNSVKQLKGKLAENTSQDMANNAVRDAIRERAERLHERDPFPVNETSAFIEDGLKHARSAVGGGKQFVSVSGKMSEKKASQTIRGAAKFLKQHGTPADKKLAAKALGESAKKQNTKAKAALAKATKRLTPKQQVAMALMREGVQVFPAEPRFSGPLRPKPGKFGEAFNVEVGFSSDDWKRLAPLVRKEATKAKWKIFEIRSDKVLRVVLKTKDAKQAQKLVSDLVDKVKKGIGVTEDCGLSHDENDKENRRTKKDNNLASVENTDPMVDRVKEQISKRKKRTSY